MTVELLEFIFRIVCESVSRAECSQEWESGCFGMSMKIHDPGQTNDNDSVARL